MSDTLTREVSGATLPAAGTYAFDTAHTRVGFSVRHMMVAKVRGQFDAPTGTFVIADDPTQSSVEVDIDWSSVSTGDPNRDAHLKSPDFFDVENHPTIHYRSTSVRHVKGDKWVVDGELTSQQITKPVELELEFNGAGLDPWGNEKVGFTATTTINREDFGLTYNAILETGGVMVGKDINIEIDVEAKKEA